MTKPVKILAFVLLIGVAGAAVSAAAAAAAQLRSPANGLLVEADWQAPQSLPRRFRNHCNFAAARHRAYCSYHCGGDYQFYFCSRRSFGCCRIGFGFCDWRGLLHCAP